MKTIKKLSCTILAMALVMLSALPTFAATDLESEILAHSFKAYQIFSADSVEGQYLTNVDWGSAFARTTNRTRFLNGLVADDSFVVAGENIFANLPMLIEQQLGVVALWQWKLRNAFIRQRIVVIADFDMSRVLIKHLF